MVTMYVSREIVFKEYEEKSQEFLNMLKNSNSKYKNTPVEKIGWFYSFSYFKNKGEFNIDYFENLRHMKFDERLEEEIRKVRVNLSMSAGNFYLTDRVESVSDIIKETVKFITIRKMVTEQSQINDQEVMDSIPIPKEEQIPMTLEEQLKCAIDEEDYEEAARIRDAMKIGEWDHATNVNVDKS